MKTGKNRQLMVNLAASVVVFIVQFAINFWLSPFVVSKLGEEAYGFIGLANNFTQYTALITVAVNSMASRFISVEYNRGNREEANQYFASVFWMNVVLSLVVILLSVIIVFNIEKISHVGPELLRDVKITFVLTFITLIISFLCTCYNATTFVTNRMDLNAYTQIGTNLIKLFVVVGTFCFMTPHIYFVSLAGVCSSVFSFVIYIVLRKRLIPEFSVGRRYFSFSKIIVLAKSGFWILISNISSLLLNGMDLLVANLLVSPIAMSRLSISKQFPTAIGSLLGFLSNIFAASFTTLVAKNDKIKLVKEIRFTCRVLGAFLTVPFAGIIIYGSDFFELWLPDTVYDSTAIRQVYILMMLTLMNVIVNAYMYSIHSLFIALDKVKVYSLMVLVSSLVSIAATVVLTKYTFLGVYAIAGTSTAVLSIVNLFLVPMYAERVLELRTFELLRTVFKNYLALGVTCLLFVVVKPFLSLNAWMPFMISAACLGCLGYVLDFAILLNRDEKHRLKATLKSRLHKS